MYNITKGNVVPMKATLVHDEERFPVGASTGLSVRIYGHYSYIDAVNVTVDQEEDGVLYFDVPATLNNGVYGVEVKGKVNGTPWRTATDCVVKITPSTERNDGSEAVPEGDTYDIVMRVQLYKQQSSDSAIEEHNSDEASHPYILGELERIEGEIPTLPEHIVTDANYVHTDNNYTTEEKTKLANAITEEQDPTVPQWAKQSTKPSYTPQEVGALPANTPLFDGDYNSLANKPDLSGFITISVNNLVNYYLKSETYTKSEVQGLIAAIQQFHYEIYASISAVTSPAGNVLYLIGPTGTGADKYEEYVYDSTKQEPWVKIGDTSIDLSNYYTKGQTDSAIMSALNTALANYTTTAALTLLLAGKQDVINDLSDIRSGASAGATAYQKPAGGIPKTDLSQGVKDSLDKADTALQEDTLYEDANGHDYVEIAGMKWATKNIGANAVTDAGLYFQWGDIQGYTAEQVGTGEGKKAFTWADYKFNPSGDGQTFTKYNATDGKTILELEDDAAHANMGGTWRMPTTEEMQAFGAAVNAVWTDDYQGSGVAGLVCTDKTDNTKVVFFPAAGYCHNGEIGGLNNDGEYLSGSRQSDDPKVDYIASFNSGTIYWNDYFDRFLGCTIRAILDTTKLKQDLDNKQDTLVSGTNIKTINNESILGSGNINIDISGKEDVTNIVAPVNATDATLPIITLTTQIGRLYRIDVAVDTLAITLPAITDNGTTRGLWIILTTGTTPNVTIASADSKDIQYYKGYKIEAETKYELNIIFDGVEWIVASSAIEVPSV